MTDKPFVKKQNLPDRSQFASEFKQQCRKMLLVKQLFRRSVGIAAVMLCGASAAFAGDLKELHGHVPGVVPGLQAKGDLPETRELRMAIGLPLRNTVELQAFMEQLYDPNSPGYRQFLTQDEFTARFGPTVEDYDAVKAFATSNGLRVVETSFNRLLLDVAGPASAVEKAFNIKLHVYRHPTEDRDFFAPDTEPTVDAALPVADVQGLSDFGRAHPRVHKNALLSGSPRAGTAPDGSGMLFGNDFRNAYAPGVTLTGAGQSIALFEADGFNMPDMAYYASAAGNGRSNISIQTVLLDGFNGIPTTGANSGELEVALDIELAMAMAPGLTKIVVVEGNPTNFFPNDILNAMLATSSTVKNLSSSWGWSGGPQTSTDNIFTNMAAVGQTYFNASGDSCAFTSGSTSANGVDNVSIPNAPSSCPIITQVGGTTLAMNGSGASYGSEVVWNWGTEIGSQYNGVGSSGGVSSHYAIPSWQKTVLNLTSRGGSTNSRNIPDVAMTADNVYVRDNNGVNEDGVGGTSCAAPLWAGFIALVNQQAVANGKPYVGFANPALYSIAATNTNYAACFHDITSGNNTWSKSRTKFYATNGYDLCTGLGSPNGAALINALAGTPVAPPPVLAVSPTSGGASGPAGGPFSISSGNFVLTNSGGSSLNWSLINTSSWLGFSATNGTLAAGAQTTVTSSLTAQANSLAPGTYTANLTFTNLTTHTAQAATFTLQVVAGPVLVVSPLSGGASGPTGGPFTISSGNFVMTNSGGSSLDWSLINTSSWLGFSATNGTLAAGAQTTAVSSLTAAANSLTPGTYNANLTFTNLTTHTAQAATFTLQVLAGPVLAVSPLSGGASGPAGGPFTISSGNFVLTNSGGSSLNWSLINTSSWLGFSATNGALAAGAQTTVTSSLTAAANSLTPGTYNANLTFTNLTTHTTQAATFTLQVVAGPVLAVSPLSGGASGPAGGPFTISSGNFVLTNSGGSSLDWSLINTSSWLGFSATNGTLAAGAQTTVTSSLTAAANSLTPGTYNANLAFTNLTTHTVQVATFTLQVNQAFFVTPPNGFTASGPIGGPFNVSSQNYVLTNNGASSLTWGVVNLPPWLTASATNGVLSGNAQTPLTISLSAEATNTAFGLYTANVQVTNSAGPATSLAFTLTVGESIVSNGGFETGEFTGWTLTGATTENFVTNGGGFVHGGAYGAALGQSGSTGVLAQTLTTVPGQNYLLSLWLENPMNPNGATPNEFAVQWDGATLYDQTNLPFTSWTNLQFVVTASSAATVLQFEFDDLPYNLGLDDVSVIPVSAPAFKTAQPGPQSFDFSWSAVVGLTYQVQFNTNVGDTNWVNIGTPMTATNGMLSFSDTNGFSSSPAGFYRVIVLP
jgi:hypothetical protein